MLEDNTLRNTWLHWFRHGEAGHLAGDNTFHLDFNFFGKRARGEIRFRPAERDEDIARFMGGEYAGAVLDEVAGTQQEAGLPEDIFTGLKMRLRQPGIGWGCRACASELPRTLIPRDRETIEVDCPHCGARRSCKPRYHIILAFNPPPPGHWANEEFPIEMRNKDLDPDVALYFIDKAENKANLPHGYYEDMERDYTKRGKLDWLTRYVKGERVAIGKSTCVFDSDKIYAALDSWAAEPLVQGTIQKHARTGIPEVVKHPEGPLRVWELPRPKGEDAYIIGADAGGGLTKDDPSCAEVISRVTGNLVAEWHGHLVPRQFAREVAALGWYYHTAFVVPEVEPSAHGRSLCDALEQLGYANIYMQRREQQQGDPYVHRYGLPMSKFNKVRIVDMGIEVITEQKFRIPNRELLLEMLAFVQHPDGKLAGDVGVHDDRVMAWLCALEGLQREGMWTPLSKTQRAPDWMWELIQQMHDPGGDRAWMAL